MPTVNLARERSLYQAFSEHAVKARQAELSQLQEQLGTGRRINRPSDDAAGYSQARQLELLGERYAQYQRTITSSRTWVDHSQAALDRLGELFTQAYEQGVRFANGTFSAQDRQTAVQSLEGLLSSITEQLNSQVSGEYLFAGSRTTQAPFTQVGNVVTYNGNAGAAAERTRRIGHSQDLVINISGQDLHDTGAGFTITEALADLITAVGTGDPAQLDTALARVQTARDHVVDQGGEAGNIGRRLQLAEAQLADAALVTEARRSAVEDTDMAEAIMRQQQAEMGLQASLRVAANLIQTTLLDYLR